MPGKVVALHEALRGAELPHAFGGALALAYYAEPRSTADIDLNVFVPPARWPEVRAALAPLGVETAGGPERAAAQARLPWGGTEAHVFLSVDALHEAMARATREVPLGGRAVPIVAAEHLLVRKALLDRAKDWEDIAAMLRAGPLDLAEAEAWLERLAGPGDPRLTRLRELAGVSS